MGRGSANRAGDATRGLDRIENWCDLPRHVVHDHQFRRRRILCRRREDATSRTAWRHNQRHLNSGAFAPVQFCCHRSDKCCRRGLRISISTVSGRSAYQCVWYRWLLRGRTGLAMLVVDWATRKSVLRILDLRIRSWRSRRLRSWLRLCAAASAAGDLVDRTAVQQLTAWHSLFIAGWWTLASLVGVSLVGNR